MTEKNRKNDQGPSGNEPDMSPRKDGQQPKPDQGSKGSGGQRHQSKDKASLDSPRRRLREHASAGSTNGTEL